MKAWLTVMKLDLNPIKTSVKNAWKEAFVFLGYELGLQYKYGTKMVYLGLRPSKKATGQFCEKVGQILKRGRSEPWEEIQEELNAMLKGWMQYFNRGSSLRYYTPLDRYVSYRVRNLMRRRHRLDSGTARFNYQEVHQDLGVADLQQLWRSKARA